MKLPRHHTPLTSQVVHEQEIRERFDEKFIESQRNHPLFFAHLLFWPYLVFVPALTWEIAGVWWALLALALSPWVFSAGHDLGAATQRRKLRAACRYAAKHGMDYELKPPAKG